jgi:hypothetical protein
LGGWALADWPVDGKAAPICGRQNSTKNQRFGGVLPLLDPVQRARFNQCTQLKYSNIPQSTIGWLGFGQIGRGMERQLCFVAVIIRKKIDFLGGVSHNQMASSGPNLIGLHSKSIQTYHNQPLGGLDLAELAGGWKSGSILWP